MNIRIIPAVRLLIPAVYGLFFVAGIPLSALAQSSENTLEEVIVTAEKRHGSVSV